MHGHRTKGGNTQEFWCCGSKKKKQTGTPCPVSGTITEKALERACCEVLDLEFFNEVVFAERVDHIEVPERSTLVFFLKDNTIVRKEAPNTGHKDCWTQEARRKASDYRRTHRATGKKGSTALTGIIKCTACGGNYHAEKQGNMRYWRCGYERDGISLREDTLQAVIAGVLGTERYDESTVEERIESILVDGNTLIFLMKDGSEERRTWVKPKRPGYQVSDAERARRSQTMCQRLTPEFRQQMSERMKQLRKERGKNWRKA